MAERVPIGEYIAAGRYDDLLFAMRGGLGAYDAPCDDPDCEACEKWED